MDYVQTVIARIKATKFEEAIQPGGLFSELDAHRDQLSARPGFRGMSITRTANPEGDVTLVAETRWSNNNAMADYSSQEPNVAGLLNQHADLLVPDSVQVLRMQSERSEAQDAPNRVYDRLGLALFVPLGVLAFAVLVIYALSRIYLVLPGNWATPMAAGIALLVLGISWYFASNPNVPRWQWAGTAAVVLAAVGIAGVGAGIYDNNHSETKEPPTPPAVTAPPPGGTPAPAGAPQIDMEDLKFVDASGNENQKASFTAKVGEPITIVNKGAAVHNVHIAASGSYGSCSGASPDPCSKPNAISGGQQGTITVNLAPGTYQFRCDFHPDQMTAQINISQ